MDFTKYSTKEMISFMDTFSKFIVENNTEVGYDMYKAVKDELKKRAAAAAKKYRFHRIDNGCGAKPDYECDNGMKIISDNYPELNGVYKYFVGDKGFEYLKDAKEYCLMFEAIAE